MKHNWIGLINVLELFVNSLCDKMCVDLKMLKIIYRGMFPYNDEENAWISKT